MCLYYCKILIFSPLSSLQGVVRVFECGWKGGADDHRGVKCPSVRSVLLAAKEQVRDLRGATKLLGFSEDWEG